MDSVKNPIEKRFDKLAGLWNEFAENPAARLLRWLADGETTRMLDMFVELQNEEVSEIPDLFLKISLPFTGGENYVLGLIQFLNDQYEEIRDGIVEEGIDADWVMPDYSGTNAQAMISVMASFQAHYSHMMEHFVAVLVPDNAASLGANWSEWLAELLSEEIPPELRFMVVDDLDAPVLDSLAEQNEAKVVSINPELNMPQAYEEVVKQAPGSGPGHDFRLLFVQLNNAAAGGDVNAAKTFGERALAITHKQHWPQLTVVVQMALGATYLTAGDFAKTLSHYQQASAAVADSKEPADAKLFLQTKMAEGSALIAGERFADAAEVYVQAHQHALSLQEIATAVDCARMAGWCYEVAEQSELAWKWGQHALNVASPLDADARKNSTLPYAGQMLLRLTDHGIHTDEKRVIESQMIDLLGPEWDHELEGVAS